MDNAQPATPAPANQTTPGDTQVQTVPPPQEIPRTHLFVLGLFLNVFLFVLALAITAQWKWPLIPRLAAGSLLFSYFGIGGLIQIPIAYRGVPLFLGGRIPRKTLTEGWNWILPRPLMGAEAINAQERTSLVDNFECLSKDNVRFKVDASVQWVITDPCKSLSIGEEVVTQGMLELIRKTLRIFVYAIEAEKVVGADQELKSTLQRGANEKATEWGVDVRNVIVSTITFASETVSKDMERKFREKHQGVAEDYEAQKYRERIKKTSEELKIPMGEARELDQTERGKVKKEIQEKKLAVSPEAERLISGVSQALSGALQTGLQSIGGGLAALGEGLKSKHEESPKPPSTPPAAKE